MKIYIGTIISLQEHQNKKCYFMMHLKTSKKEVIKMSKELYSIHVLKEKGIPHKIIELSRPPRNAQDIAEMFGCQIDQVVKTLLFVGDKNVLCCLPGNKNVDLQKLCKVVKAKYLRLAKPQEVKEITGLEVGGLCPFIKSSNLIFVLDAECLKKVTINIGAGTKTTGIELTSEDLRKVWPGSIANISQK